MLGRALATTALLLLGLVLLPASGHAQVFTDVSSFAGVTAVQHTHNDPPNCLLFFGQMCEPERMSGGAAVGDVDGDGLPDLLVTRLDDHDLLFRNLGNGRFEDFSEDSGLAAFSLASNGARFADIDNDADLDLYITTIGDTRFYLFVNDGSGNFSEEAIARGAAIESLDPHVGFGIAVGDYDRDGFVDLFTAEWRPENLSQSGSSHSRLLRNRGAQAPGFFEDKTDFAGVAIHDLTPGQSWAFAPAFVDLDDDGHPDLALASDFGTSRLFWNQGDGRFADATLAAGVGSDENGMGSTFGDVDADGDLDWFVTSIFDPEDTCAQQNCNWGATGNRLYLNQGDRSFQDGTDAWGVRDGAWGWGTRLFDADNDGDLDLVMTNGVDFPESQAGTLDDAWEQDAMRFWRSDGSTMVEDAAGVGLTDTGSGKGLLVFDYDVDGDLDLLVANNSSGPRLYRNDTPSAGDWLRVELVGDHSNAEGLGARVSLQKRPGDPLQVHQVGAGSHFLGQSERIVHFGLGDTVDNVFMLEVEWPSGARERHNSIAPNQTLRIREGWRCGLGGLEAATLLCALLGLRRLRRS